MGAASLLILYMILETIDWVVIATQMSFFGVFRRDTEGETDTQRADARAQPSPLGS